MNESTAGRLEVPAATSQDVLTEILRDGAQRLLSQAVEAEVCGWIESHKHVIDDQGRRQVVRNGHLPTRGIITGVGPVEITQPRVHDRRGAGARDEHGRLVEPFRSKILPPYLRKTKSVEELIPWLYLKGISTGDFTESLQALLGPNAPGLSATTVTRLITTWQKDYEAWSTLSLAGKQYVYVWADAVYFNIRLDEDRQCILVLMGATPEGRKDLIAVTDGYRESEQSWRQLLLDCKQRGLQVDPKLATGDGALGFWKALRQVYPATREQRCWVHIAGRHPRLPEGCKVPSRANPHEPGSLGSGVAEQSATSKQTRHSCLSTQSGGGANSRAVPKGNVFGVVMAFWTFITGRVQDWGGRVACVPTKAAATMEGMGT